MIDVLFAENSTPFSYSQHKFLSEYLPAPVMEQAVKFRRWQDAQAHILGRHLLVEGLQKYGFPKSVLPTIHFTEYKRPYVSNGIDFNISHSGKYVVCAIGKSMRLGIDIEEVHPIDIGDFREQFTEGEFESIVNAPDIYRAFFNCWTIKEAVMKADGRGLNLPLTEIKINRHAIVNGKNWFVEAIDIDEGYAVHLATDVLLEGKVIPKNVPLNKNRN